MWNLGIGFDRPEYLLLLLLVPVLWALSYRTLSSLGRLRRIVAIGLRTLVLTLLVLALAELQLERISDKITVIYLLDQSESIPRIKRELMRDYVIQDVRKNRDATRNDRAGVIVFGREAAIEVPPFDDDIPDTGSFEAFLERRDATNLESALKLAAASFPEDTAKRLVIVTDGNENIGSANSVAPTLTGNGIGIDVVPVRLATRAEVAVEKVTLPADIRRGTPFEVRTVLTNFLEGDRNDATRTVRGKLRVTRHAGGREELVGEETVELPPGKTVVGFRHSIDKPAMYTYQSVFVPDDAADDLLPQNNQASAFTHVRGRGRVLLIEDSDQRGDSDYLVERLRIMNLEIDVQASDQLFTSLSELQGYDCVVLANVPRSSGRDPSNVSSFRDEQIEMLVRNTQQMGAGLIMLGGPNSFGAGGWANTPLEAAMPVDFQIKNAKIEAVGALVLVMHASEMAEGNHWQKVVAREAIQTLGPMDYCGLLHWDDFGRETWLWGGNQGLVRISNQRNQMLALLNRMTPGDMPEFEPSLKMGLAAFNKVSASIKHMIVVSDGDPVAPFATTLNLYKQAGIQISTVAVGTHGPAGSTPLRDIAAVTGGQYYVVTDPKVLPKIYQREARRVSRPLVKELENVAPDIVYPHEILEGIDGPLPPIRGMVLTTVKENPLVEVAIRSPIPSDTANSTILAAWTYGLGRAAVVTTDAGHRWASAWTQWENYDKFYSQLIRWAMRPSSDRGKFTVAADSRDGKVRVVVTALDANDEFRNSLNMYGAAVGPDLQPFDFKIRQVAPGRYVGEFDASKTGSYHLTVVPAAGEAPLLTGVNVPYSAEFRDRDTNMGLLQHLAALRPSGGQAGVLSGVDLDASQMEQLLTLNAYRPDLPQAVSIRDVWPALLLACSCIFLADVFVRRVTLTVDWILPALYWVRSKIVGRRVGAEVEQRLEHLRSKKQELSDSIDQRRAATRFSPDADDTSGPTATGGVAAELADLRSDAAATAATKKPQPPAILTTPEAADPEEYTSRLLKAKQKARDEQQSKRKYEP
ncbi:MAG: VWA domain-containing protein [Pirellulaceae bacterium]